MSETSPLADIHDPREHFRKLFGDTQAALMDHIRAVANAVTDLHTNEDAAKHFDRIAEVQKSTTQLAMFVATTLQEANRIGFAEGREERDISENIFRAALELLEGPTYGAADPDKRAWMREWAIQQARLLWDETRRSVLETQAAIRAKHRAEAEALVRDFARDFDASAKPESPG